jgi:hypothetical protein
MTCWRCGRSGEHADFCSDGTPNDCTHCGGNPCRWWCRGADFVRAEPPRPACEDDFIVEGICCECDTELLS